MGLFEQYSHSVQSHLQPLGLCNTGLKQAFEEVSYYETVDMRVGKNPHFVLLVTNYATI